MWAYIIFHHVPDICVKLVCVNLGMLNNIRNTCVRNYDNNNFYGHVQKVKNRKNSKKKDKNKAGCHACCEPPGGKSVIISTKSVTVTRHTSTTLWIRSSWDPNLRLCIP